MEIEGIITEIVSANIFSVNGQRVRTTSETRFENGTKTDIEVNTGVEVEGVVDTNGSLIAEEVEFRRDFCHSDWNSWNLHR
jgi:hypothetical protein